MFYSSKFFSKIYSEGLNDQDGQKRPWYCLLCVPEMEPQVLCHISAFLVGLTQILVQLVPVDH